MRCALAVILLTLACGGHGGGHPATPALQASGPQLPPPPPVDATARGSAYLTALGTRIQPAWAQFLEDCRLRLPVGHALNQPGLVAVAELAIARTGKVDARIVTGSGNGDFDTAAWGVLNDAKPIPIPPPELASDDDLVHVRWMFARDSRQAGAATAQVLDVRLPLLGVVERMLAKGALARAAARIAISPVDEPDRLAATEKLMIATLREGLHSPNGGARRAAAEAVGRANVQVLAGEIHALVAPIADIDLRLVAIQAAGQLRDPAVVPALLADLQTDLAQRPRIGLAKLDALVALGHGGDAVAAIKAELANGPTQTGLAALALVPDAELAPKLATWLGSKDAHVRAAVCAALPAAAPDRAVALVLRGTRDADATVRAACTDASVRDARERKIDANVRGRLRELARDRDRGVRARAIAALGVVEPAHRLRALDDGSVEVRLASVVGASETDLRVLAADRDGDVRAAAIAALGDRAPELVGKATTDLGAVVRKAAIVAVDSDDVLERMARDDSPDVATAALVKLASRRGRAAMASPLVTALASDRTKANHPERVRIALAWLLAR